MAEQDTAPDTVDTDAPDTSTDTVDTDKTEDADDHPYKEDMRKAAERRDKAVAEARALKAELKALKAPKDDNPEPTEADKYRAALVRTAGAAALATSGITERADQEAILSMLKVDGLDVSEDGTVDTDTLTDTLDTLRRIFGKPDRPRPPRVDSTRGQGDGGSGADPDTLRYKRIMGRA